MLMQEVADIIEDHAPRSLGHPADTLGLLVGKPEDVVKGVVTCWSATMAVLQKAVETGANLLICHEPLTYGLCGRDVEAGLKWYDERHPTAKIPNQRRMALVLAEGITVYRYHTNWDVAKDYGITDTLARTLELPNEYVGTLTARTYIIEPTSVREMAKRARLKLGLGPIRLVGDPDRIVSRVAICQGGKGQMFTFAEVAGRDGAELAIFGEMLEGTILYCVECGLAAIELGHFKTEEFGMDAMAKFLRERLPKTIDVQSITTGNTWIDFEE